MPGTGQTRGGPRGDSQPIVMHPPGAWPSVWSQLDVEQIGPRMTRFGKGPRTGSGLHALSEGSSSRRPAPSTVSVAGGNSGLCVCLLLFASFADPAVFTLPPAPRRAPGGLCSSALSPSPTSSPRLLCGADSAAVLPSDAFHSEPFPSQCKGRSVRNGGRRA